VIVVYIEEFQNIFYHDFHVHTAYSPCARDKSQATPLVMIKEAERLGIKTVGFSDHFAQFPPYPLPKWENSGKEMIASLRKDLQRINTPIQILIGVESDLLEEGKLSINKEYAAGLDYVIISASHFHLPGIKKPSSTKIISIAQHYVNMLKAALEFDFISIIAHPFKTPKNALGSPMEYIEQIPQREYYEIAEKALKQGIAMEINGQLGLDQEYLAAIKPFVSVCKEVGVKFSYGSDAHHKKNLKPTTGIIQFIKSQNLSCEYFLTPNESIKIHQESYS
jgi:histidinol phosphatase-like PHP family hydrolase